MFKNFLTLIFLGFLSASSSYALSIINFSDDYNYEGTRVLDTNGKKIFTAWSQGSTSAHKHLPLQIYETNGPLKIQVGRLEADSGSAYIFTKKYEITIEKPVGCEVTIREGSCKLSPNCCTGGSCVCPN